jgi:hypothetical protein
MMNNLFLKGHRSKLVHKGLVGTLQDNKISLSTVKNSPRRFKSGDFPCGYEEGPGRPRMLLDSALQRFLKKFPLASARAMAGHFSVDQATIKSILDRQPTLRRFIPRWVSHIG